MNFKIITISIIGVIMSLLLYFTLLINSKDTTVNFSTSIKMWNQHLFPQGWSFFTKSPRDEEISIYQIIDNKVKPIKSNSFSLKNYFGLKRKNRTINTDLGLINSELSNKIVWNNYSNSSIKELNLKNSLDFVKYKFKFLYPSIEKGRYVIVKKEIIPWAYWSQNYIICKNCQISYLWIQ